MSPITRHCFCFFRTPPSEKRHDQAPGVYYSIPGVKKRCFRLLSSFLLPVALFIACGGSIEPMDPTGIAVWADDCDGIACAVNKADFDGRVAMNHETNMRYDIVLYDKEGTSQKTLLFERKVDGYASSVETLFYMKSRGYLLIETLMYDCGGRLFEKVSFNGASTRLYHLSCDKITDNLKIVPSPEGTYIAMGYFTGSGAECQCQVTFYDSSGTVKISVTEKFSSSSVATLRWQSDSILEVLTSGSGNTMKVMGPATAVSDSVGLHCSMPQTSSSAYCPENGYVSFNGTAEEILFSSAPPSYLDWCK